MWPLRSQPDAGLGSPISGSGLAGSSKIAWAHLTGTCVGQILRGVDSLQRGEWAEGRPGPPCCEGGGPGCLAVCADAGDTGLWTARQCCQNLAASRLRGPAVLEPCFRSDQPTGLPLTAGMIVPSLMNRPSISGSAFRACRLGTTNQFWGNVPCSNHGTGHDNRSQCIPSFQGDSSLGLGYRAGYLAGSSTHVVQSKSSSYVKPYGTPGLRATSKVTWLTLVTRIPQPVASLVSRAQVCSSCRSLDAGSSTLMVIPGAAVGNAALPPSVDSGHPFPW